MTYEEIVLALSERIVPIAWWPGRVFFAGAAKAEETARRLGIALEAIVDDRLLLRALQRELDSNLRRTAVRTLIETAPEFSASVRLSATQIVVALAGLTVLSGSVYCWPSPIMALLGVVCALFFLLVIGLKVLSLWPLPRTGFARQLPDALLPTYSVLVPLFRETEVAEQLLSALLELDYPHDRLDIKLVLEANDLATRALINSAELPPHMEAIVVPACPPQTKPKALNYALQFARGDLVTVFDAEDRPDPDQLRLAAEPLPSRRSIAPACKRSCVSIIPMRIG
ncbi:MAG: glycosyltransferase [Hyphomicrobiales bacterium]